MEMNLDSRKAVTLPPAPPLIDFADATTYNNATSLTVYDAKGQDVAMSLLFPEGRDRHLERLRHRQRHARWRGTAGAPSPVTTINFPRNGSAPTAPGGAVRIDIPASINSVGAQTAADPQPAARPGRRHAVRLGLRRHRHPQDGYTPGC